MSTKSIDQPRDGWEWDASLGAWVAIGSSVEEAPEDGKQYGRQDADWTEVVATGGGGPAYDDTQVKADIQTNADAIAFNAGEITTLENAVQVHETEIDDNAAAIVTESQERDDADVALGVRIDNLSASGGYDDTQIFSDLADETAARIAADALLQDEIDNLSGGGGSAVSSVNGKTGTVVLDHTDVGAAVDGNYALVGASYTTSESDLAYQAKGNYALVGASYTTAQSDASYQAKGNYALVGASYTTAESDASYQAKGNYALVGASYTTAESDSKYALKNSGGAVTSVNGFTGAVNLTWSNVGAEKAFTKGNAFNKNFGTSSSTVAYGNHNHSGVYATASHTHSEYASTSYAYSKAQSDAKYELKGGGGGADPLNLDNGISLAKGNARGSNYQTKSVFEMMTTAGSLPNHTGFELSAEMNGGWGSQAVKFCIGSTWGTYNTSPALTIKDEGCYATDFIASSDEKLKKNIVTVKSDLIQQLEGREWDWKRDDKKASGVIAQEVEKVIPHLVEEDSEGIKRVAYNGLTAYLIEAVKELSARVKELEESK